jgi:hypothetical protein
MLEELYDRMSDGQTLRCPRCGSHKTVFQGLDAEPARGSTSDRKTIGPAMPAATGGRTME